VSLGVRVKINDYCILERNIMYDDKSKEYLAKLYFLTCEIKRSNKTILTEVEVNLILNHARINIEEKRTAIKNYSYAVAYVEHINKTVIEPLIGKKYLNKLAKQLELLYENTMRRGKGRGEE